jgi:hypothetical protein
MQQGKEIGPERTTYFLFLFSQEEWWLVTTLLS